MLSKSLVRPIAVCWRDMCVVRIDRASFQRRSCKRSAFVRKTLPMCRRRTSKIQFIKETPSLICIRLTSKHFRRLRAMAMAMVMAMAAINRMSSMICMSHSSNSSNNLLSNTAVRRLLDKRKCTFADHIYANGRNFAHFNSNFFLFRF